MIDPDTTSNEPVVYKTVLPSGETWVSGTYVKFVTPGRTHLQAHLIVNPTDKRAIEAHHKRGAVVAQDVYRVPLDLVMGPLSRTAALTRLLDSPQHALREEYISKILDSLESIAEHYVVSA